MSKNLIFASLMAISVTSLLAHNVHAEEPITADYSITPRQLISLARQGRFKAQEIASHGRFRTGVRSGKITAAKLVESAIASQRLPAAARSDQQYLDTLRSHLRSGGCGF